MADTHTKRDDFIKLLHELFQLDQPELDFGFYRVMHAKSGQIKRFIEEELSQYIDQAFAGRSSQSAEARVEEARQAIVNTLGENAFDTGELKAQHHETPVGKRFLEAQQELREGGVLSDEAQIYDHLYRFFSRYYDQGDFLSTRYRQAPFDTRDAPYSVPYDGREVYFHWANKDQYYIKSSETLRNFSFDLNAAVKQLNKTSGPGTSGGFDFGEDDTPRRVEFRIVDAAEGAHGNVKESDQRFFLIHDAEPIRLEDGQLTIQFEYRPDANKTGQNSAWQAKRLAEAEAAVFAALDSAGHAAEPFKHALATVAPTDKDKQRTLLAKFVTQYTARHTMDYFIHKNLGGFLRRELDFYIKNEVMHLDHIDSADLSTVKDYLRTIKVVRKIAHHIIEFLAQLEDFQKKLWLKKKLVTETNYCITLDHIDTNFYQSIATNKNQHDDWKRLHKISEMDGYSTPLKISFLKANTALMVDTKNFEPEFREALISSIERLHHVANGTIIEAENLAALNLIEQQYQRSIDSIYIDPPYNTDASAILYKNNYKNSSWLALIQDRVTRSRKILSDNGIFCAAIDDEQFSGLKVLLEQQFPKEIGVSAVRSNPQSRKSRGTFSPSHEYALFFGNSSEAIPGGLALTENA